MSHLNVLKVDFRKSIQFFHVLFEAECNKILLLFLAQSHLKMVTYMQQANFLFIFYQLLFFCTPEGDGTRTN